MKHNLILCLISNDKLAKFSHFTMSVILTSSIPVQLPYSRLTYNQRSSSTGKGFRFQFGLVDSGSRNRASSLSTVGRRERESGKMKKKTDWKSVLIENWNRRRRNLLCSRRVLINFKFAQIDFSNMVPFVGSLPPDGANGQFSLTLRI